MVASKPTEAQINRIVGLLRTGKDISETGWHREDGFHEGEKRPCIIFGSGTWPEYRRGIYEDEIVEALNRYDVRFVAAGI